MSVFVRAFGATLLAIELIACSLESPPAGPVGGILAIVSVDGGDCQGQGCGDAIVIGLDGSVRRSAPMEVSLGTLPGPTLAALKAAINAADYDAIRAETWEGQCTDDLTGQISYEFVTPGGTERVFTCNPGVDAKHPLFVALDAALSSVVEDPP